LATYEHQEVTDVPICFDSTSAVAIKKGLETIKGGKSGEVLED